MAEKRRQKPKITNEISDKTGQFDARFMLWRQFCAEYDVPVETLPSDLTGKARERWDQIKSENLDKKK
ncbi:MAG: hypothetical protein LC800_06915 [Acidobacteria bacterium]|nr:hypothetical protein [Acidobacteriota bacterium]